MNKNKDLSDKVLHTSHKCARLRRKLGNPEGNPAHIYHWEVLSKTAVRSYVLDPSPFEVDDIHRQ